MNLIVICLDTFRADMIGPGKAMSDVRTPNLDALAELDTPGAWLWRARLLQAGDRQDDAITALSQVPMDISSIAEDNDDGTDTFGQTDTIDAIAEALARELGARPPVKLDVTDRDQNQPLHPTVPSPDRRRGSCCRPCRARRGGRGLGANSAACNSPR